MYSILLTLFALPFFKGVTCAPVAQNATAVADPTVTISSGIVIGTTTAVVSASQSTATVNKYLGIPFAAAPTGDRRFAPPEQPSAWSTPMEAKTLPPACIQQFLYPKNTQDFLLRVFNNPGGPQLSESEDCLYLNVFAPSNASSSDKKKVLFYIFGGNLQFGASSLVNYDGSSFAGFQDVVVVTINYRTNIFGFSASPEIPAGQQNVGFLDQRLALQWVQANIASFGGDPTKVTIFGESAGGVSVKQLLAQPPSPLPFRAAIMQSEQAVLPGTGLASYQATLRKFGCNEADSPIQCLRQVSAADIKSWIETNDIFFAPTNDHVTFTTDVRPNIRNKEFADVPFFMGTNADEGRVFAAAFGFDNSSATIKEVVSIIFPNDPVIQDAVAAFYAPFFTDAFLFGSAVLTDLGFTCTTSSLSNYAISNGYSSVWRYLYSAVFPNLSVFPNAGSFHTSEIPQVWGTYPLEGVTPEQEQLSKFMQATWANFAKNPSAGPGWNRLGSTFSTTLAEIGGSKAPTGKAMISPSSVDYVCAIYNPIISVIGL